MYNNITVIIVKAFKRENRKVKVIPPFKGGKKKATVQAPECCKQLSG